MFFYLVITELSFKKKTDYLFGPHLQVLLLVPPGRTSGEDGSPYSGQVVLYEK
jgi:hypothetical protein